MECEQLPLKVECHFSATKLTRVSPPQHNCLVHFLFSPCNVKSITKVTFEAIILPPERGSSLLLIVNRGEWSKAD